MLDEQLSEFIDGECDADAAGRALAALLQDPDRRAAWQRQLWLREALRGEAPPLDIGFADRVASALDGEGAAAGKVVSMHRRGKRRWRAGAGLATAASLAAGVLLVGNLLQQGEHQVLETRLAAAPAAGIAGANGGAENATAGSAAVDSAAGLATPVHTVAYSGASDHWTVSDPAVANQLNGYLIEHNGVARGYGLAGATPSFLRVATYGQRGNR